MNFIKQVQRYGLSNHLYWLSQNKPGGHQIWQFLNNITLDYDYEQILASLGKCDTLICECEIQ